MGLPEKAQKLLRSETVRVHPCLHCGRDDGPASKVIDRVGMFDDLPLLEYRLKDGRTAKEVVQEEIWSSGPMIWLALELSDGSRIEWSAEDIKEMYD